jgi:hypothetical protein
LHADLIGIFGNWRSAHAVHVRLSGETFARTQ